MCKQCAGDGCMCREGGCVCNGKCKGRQLARKVRLRLQEEVNKDDDMLVCLACFAYKYPNNVWCKCENDTCECKGLCDHKFSPTAGGANLICARCRDSSIVCRAAGCDLKASFFGWCKLHVACDCQEEKCRNEEHGENEPCKTNMLQEAKKGNRTCWTCRTVPTRCKCPGQNAQVRRGGEGMTGV